MRIQFYDDPVRSPRPPDEVQINRIGLYVHEDLRRVAIGLDITPFSQRPSLAITVVNERDEPAASMAIIETLESNFTLTMHLRDRPPARSYTVRVEVYYPVPADESEAVAGVDEDGQPRHPVLTGRHIVDTRTITFDLTQPGEVRLASSN